MFKQGDFQVAQGTTPEQLARKRQAIRDMVSKYGTARYTGQGLAHMLTGALNGFKEHKYGKYEGEQQSAANEGFDAATGTEGYEAALANPWTTPEQKSVIAMRMQRDAQEAALARQQAAQARSAGAASAADAKAAAERQASMDLVSQFFTQGMGGQGGGQGGPAPMAPPTRQAAAMQAYGGPTMGAAQALAGGQGMDTINGNSGADVLGVGGDTLGGGMSDDVSSPAQQLSAFDAYNGYKSSEPAPMPQPAPLPEVMAPKPAPMAAPRFDPQMAAQIIMNPSIPKEIKEQVMAMAFPQEGPQFRVATPQEAQAYGAKSGQFDTETGRFYPGKDAPSSEAQIQRIMSTGVDRETAIGIADGVIVADRDPLTREVSLLNKATGERYSAPAQAAAAPQSAPEPDALSFGMEIPSGGDAAFGLKGLGANIANTLTDAVGFGEVMPEAAEHTRFFKNIEEDLLVGLSQAYGRQPAQALMERIRSLIPQAGTLEGADRARGELEQLERRFARDLALTERQMERRMAPDSRAEAEQRLAGINSTLSIISEARQRLGDPATSAAPGSNVTSTGLKWKIVE